jgi:hypothetical protein
MAVERGTKLHDLARQHIELGIPMPKTKRTLDSFVNDALGFRMTPEQPLVYSYNFFGTADAISFRNKFLRIHDLKTGESPVSMEQLEIYAALYCLEYKTDPFDIQIELRIYQCDEIVIERPNPEVIRAIMDTIIEFDKELDKTKLEV